MAGIEHPKPSRVDASPGLMGSDRMSVWVSAIHSAIELLDSLPRIGFSPGKVKLAGHRTSCSAICYSHGSTVLPLASGCFLTVAAFRPRVHWPPSYSMVLSLLMKLRALQDQMVELWVQDWINR